MSEHTSTLTGLGRILALSSLLAPAHAQQVTIPDPGLNAAIFETLQESRGPFKGCSLTFGAHFRVAVRAEHPKQLQ